MLKAGGGIKETEPSRRYYLADACFLVGLAGEDLALLQQLQAALQDPVWPLCLGRKAFVPGEPIWLNDGLRQDTDLGLVLETYPWLGIETNKRSDRVRVVREDPGGPEVRPDQPISFAERQFRPATGDDNLHPDGRFPATSFQRGGAMYLSRLILNPRTPPRPTRAGRTIRDAPFAHEGLPA